MKGKLYNNIFPVQQKNEQNFYEHERVRLTSQNGQLFFNCLEKT